MICKVCTVNVHYCAKFYYSWSFRLIFRFFEIVVVCHPKIAYYYADEVWGPEMQHHTIFCQ